MQFQLGEKKIHEIESLIDTNCWKAFFWIHSLLLYQIKYIFYYKNQTKHLGSINLDIKFTKEESKKGIAVRKIKIQNGEEHKKKWDKLERPFQSMDTAINLCYSRSLIDEEVEDLKTFNSYRNKIMGHADISKLLPPDNEVKSKCRKGIEIVKRLDTKIVEALKPL